MHLISFTGHISMAQQPLCLGQNIFFIFTRQPSPGAKYTVLATGLPQFKPWFLHGRAVYAEARLLLVLRLSFPNGKIMITVRIEVQ